MGRRQRPTVRAIAEQLNISPGTVSRALADHGNRPLVSRTTQKRVRAAAQRMGYPLHRLRTRLPRLRRVGLFGAVDALYQELFELVSTHLDRKGVLSVAYAVADRAQQFEMARRWYRRHELDAAVFVGDRSTLDEPTEADPPCVFVGGLPPGAPVWKVEADHEGGGRLVGEHLWALGHRHVGIVGVEGRQHADQRLAGLCSVWKRRGVDWPAEHVLRLSVFSEDELLGKLPGFLRRAERGGKPLTAIFAWGDTPAAYIMNWLLDAGVRVPDQMSVAGFDDYVIGSFLRPALTTVRRPVSALAEQATRLLLERLHFPDQAPQSRRLPCELVVRNSTGPVPESNGPQAVTLGSWKEGS